VARQIGYCDLCGARIAADDMENGRAAIIDARSFCTACMAESGFARKQAAAPAPPAPPATTRRSAGPAPPPRRWAMLVVPGAGIAALGLLLVFVLTGGEPAKPAPPPPPPVEVSKTTRPDTTGDEAMRTLENLASAGADPSAIMAECERLRPVLHGTKHAARLDAIVEQAAAAKRKLEARRGLEAKVDTFRAEAEGDTTFIRAHAVASEAAALRELLGDAADLKARVDEIVSAHRARFDKEAARLRDEVLGAAQALADAKKYDQAVAAVDAYPAAFRETPHWKELSAMRRAWEQLAGAPPPPTDPPASTRPWHELADEAFGHYKSRNYGKAKELYLEAMPLLPARAPNDKHESWWYYAPYNLSTIFAYESDKLTGDDRTKAHEACRKWLRQAIDAGYMKRKCRCHGACLDHFRKDAMFNPVRREAWFAELEKSAGK